MQAALSQLSTGQTPAQRVSFGVLRDIVGFDAHDALLASYETSYESSYDAGRGD